MSLDSSALLRFIKPILAIFNSSPSYKDRMAYENPIQFQIPTLITMSTLGLEGLLCIETLVANFEKIPFKTEVQA